MLFNHQLQREAEELQAAIDHEDEFSAAAPTSHIDDEYSRAGIEDPQVYITTSRSPSSRLAQFAKVNKIDEIRYLKRCLKTAAGNENSDPKLHSSESREPGAAATSRCLSQKRL